MASVSPAMVVAMMVAMMLPSIAPALWRNHRVLTAMETPHANCLITMFVLGYASVWTPIGLGLFALGTAVTPTSWMSGLVIVAAGALQRTPWKARQLARCRDRSISDDMLPKSIVAVWRAGWCLGVHCVLSCAAATAVLFVVGQMDMRAMAVITAAITAERLTPAGPRVARMTGALALCVGLVICVGALANAKCFCAS